MASWSKVVYGDTESIMIRLAFSLLRLLRLRLRLDREMRVRNPETGKEPT